MKYYKKLLANKKYITLLIILFLTMLGLSAVYINFISFIVDGVRESGLSFYHIISNGLPGLLASSNIGMAIVGLLIIYIALVFIPRNIPKLQQDSDYFVESRNDKIYIRFRKYEFELEKETFEPTKLMFRDINKKFVSVTLAYQIYNYINYKYKNILEKEISNPVTEKNIISVFKGIKNINEDELNNYIKYRNLKKTKFFQKVLGFIWLYIALMLIIGVFVLEDRAITERILFVILGAIFTLLAYNTLRNTNQNKRLLNKIKNGKMYIADAHSFDKKIMETSNETNYEVKVWDNCNEIDKWFKISNESYKNSDIVTGKLYIIDYNNEIIIDFISNYDLDK